jgi:O-antigen ligase
MPVTTQPLAAAGNAVLTVFLTLILASLVHVHSLRWLIPGGLVGLAALAAWRPAAALLTVATLTPIANYIGRRWNYQVAWAETIVIAFGAGYACWRVRSRADHPLLPAGLRVPAAIFALVVCASSVVQLAVDDMRVGSTELTRVLWQFFSRDYFVSGSDQHIHAAAFLLEGLLLFSAAARFASADGRFLKRMGVALAASAVLASAINLEALAASAARSGQFWIELGRHLRSTRINLHYADVNAAGSYFAMMLFVCGALAASGRRAERAWFLGAAVLALGIYTTGSRAALLACALGFGVVAVAWTFRRARPARRAGMWAGGALLLATAIVVVLLYAPTRGNQTSSSTAATVRVEMGRTTLRMLSRYPVFGIGLGQFYQRSGEFSSPELLQLFPRASHENAHNNFLQVLAEIGIVGFSAFVWLLTSALYAGWRHLRREPSDILVWGCLAGAATFIFTWLAGHPLLTREPAYAFWMLLGATAGHAYIARNASVLTARTWATSAVAIAAMCLIISLPPRSATARAEADFEHLGIGLSVWQTSADNVRYRSAVNSATLFVPGEKGFRFRVRTLSPAPERLELRLGDRVVDVVLLAPNQWNDVAMPPRSDTSDTRYTTLHLRIVADPSQAVTLWITKIEALER